MFVLCKVFWQIMVVYWFRFLNEAYFDYDLFVELDRTTYICYSI